MRKGILNPDLLESRDWRLWIWPQTHDAPVELQVVAAFEVHLVRCDLERLPEVHLARVADEVPAQLHCGGGSAYTVNVGHVAVVALLTGVDLHVRRGVQPVVVGQRPVEADVQEALWGQTHSQASRRLHSLFVKRSAVLYEQLSKQKLLDCEFSSSCFLSGGPGGANIRECSSHFKSTSLSLPFSFTHILSLSSFVFCQLHLLFLFWCPFFADAEAKTAMAAISKASPFILQG